MSQWMRRSIVDAAINCRRYLRKSSRNIKLSSPASITSDGKFVPGGLFVMRRALGLGLSLVALAALFAIESRASTPNKTAMATITGSVKDNKGNPLPGALVSLLKEGARQILKETKTDPQGNFIAKVSPGRYVLRAIAKGFSEVVFSSFEVRASQELVYRFNLEPIGSGKTLPERRKDRENVRWVLRSA